MDEGGLPYRRAVEHVSCPRPLRFPRQRQLDGLPLGGRAIECLNDFNIDEPF